MQFTNLISIRVCSVVVTCVVRMTKDRKYREFCRGKKEKFVHHESTIKTSENSPSWFRILSKISCIPVRRASFSSMTSCIFSCSSETFNFECHASTESVNLVEWKNSVVTFALVSEKSNSFDVLDNLYFNTLI